MGLISDLFVRIKGDKSHLSKELDGAKRDVTSFGSVLTKIGGLLGIAFGIREIANFSKEAMKLAAEAEGVKNAFMKIGDAKGVLEDMKRATRGVIEESDLMQLAVKAQNFKIPLKDLGTYLEFATNRAITTGKSVADLTELIVTGLGRKSSRSFVQLGLSAKDVQEAMKTTGGMLNLVTGALEKMGPVADSAATRYGKMAAEVKNLKEAWGGFLNNSGLIQTAVKNLTDLFKMLGDEGLTAWQKLTMGPKDYEAYINEIAMRKSLDESRNSVFTYKDYLKKDEPILIDPEEAKKEAKALEELKNAHKIFWAETQQSNKLPQNNKTTSVFDTKTFGVSTGNKGKLSGGPNANPAHYGVGSVAGMLSDVDVDLAMAKMDDFQKRLKEALTAMRDMSVEYGAQIIEAIGSALGGGNTKELGKELLMGLARFLTEFGTLLIAVGLGLEGLKDSIATMDPATALVAGAALLVAAGAIRGLMSKGVSGSSAGGGGYTGSAGRQTIKIEGHLKGKDIYWSNQRYAEENS